MASSEIKIALAGNPNSGKTTLFNALTGSNQFVGNAHWGAYGNFIGGILDILQSASETSGSYHRLLDIEDCQLLSRSIAGKTWVTIIVIILKLSGSSFKIAD